MKCTIGEGWRVRGCPDWIQLLQEVEALERHSTRLVCCIWNYKKIKDTVINNWRKPWWCVCWSKSTDCFLFVEKCRPNHRKSLIFPFKYLDTGFSLDSHDLFTRFTLDWTGRSLNLDEAYPPLYTCKDNCLYVYSFKGSYTTQYFRLRLCATSRIKGKLVARPLSTTITTIQEDSVVALRCFFYKVCLFNTKQTHTS